MAHIRDTKPDKRNARRHNPRNIGMIESSRQRDGFGRSILLANDGTIIAGNATSEAAASAGLEDMIVVESDGTKIIAVKRIDVEPYSERFHNLSTNDNRSAELADWDGPVLQSLIDDGDLDPSLFWFDEELDALLANMKEPQSFDTSPQLGTLEYRIVIDCASENHQADLLARFESEGITCRALIS